MEEVGRIARARRFPDLMPEGTQEEIMVTTKRRPTSRAGVSHRPAGTTRGRGADIVRAIDPDLAPSSRGADRLDLRGLARILL